jgi:hypothetical protein
MQCINCDQPAVWLFKAVGVADREYCNVHLPAAYRGTKNVTPLEKPAPAGVFEKITPEEEAVLAETAASPTVRRARRKAPKTVPVEDAPAAVEALLEPVEETEEV